MTLNVAIARLVIALCLIEPCPESPDSWIQDTKNHRLLFLALARRGYSLT